MTLPERFTLRAIARSEEDAFVDALVVGFSEQLREGEADLWRRFRSPERTWAVFDGDDIVATTESLPWHMTVPYAGVLPCAAVTSVAVVPTHRRRGLLRALMVHTLHAAHDAGEPVAALYASEGGIYNRFGYGIAATHFTTKVERDHSSLRRPVDVTDAVRYVEPARAPDALAPIHDRAIRHRPGAMQRVAAAWDAKVTFDPESDRDGFGPRQVALVDGRGYALFRTRIGWADNAPRHGVVKVEELIATDPEAEAVLWTFLFGIDLMSFVEASGRPPDDPLRLLLVDPAREIRRFANNFYVRIVDVPAALTGRGYATDGELVLGVTDPLCPWNERAWRLSVSDGRASCDPTDADADVELEVIELGATYLGGVTFTALADAGLARQTTSGALERADRLFAAERAPWNPTEF